MPESPPRLVVARLTDLDVGAEQAADIADMLRTIADWIDGAATDAVVATYPSKQWSNRISREARVHAAALRSLASDLDPEEEWRFETVPNHQMEA